MVNKKEVNRIRGLLSEAVSVLCKASLSYRTDFHIEGLVGITIDSEEIFLVKLDEVVKKPLLDNASAGPGNELQKGMISFELFKMIDIQQLTIKMTYISTKI